MGRDHVHDRRLTCNRFDGRYGGLQSWLDGVDHRGRPSGYRGHYRLQSEGPNVVTASVFSQANKLTGQPETSSIGEVIGPPLIYISHRV